jgi:hypothetical protein
VKTPAWQRAAGKNPRGGLNAKGRASYKAQTGGTLKAPVKGAPDAPQGFVPDAHGVDAGAAL